MSDDNGTDGTPEYIKKARRAGVELSEELIKDAHQIAAASSTDFTRIIKLMLREQNTKLNEDQILNMIQRRFGTDTTDAEDFRGVIFGYSVSNDILQRKKERRKQKFEDNPEEATRKGLTDKEGTPLWTEDDNSYQATPGEPIGERYILNVYGVAEKNDSESDVRFFELTAFESDPAAFRDNFEVGGEYIFKANDKSNTDEFYDLGFSTATNWEQPAELGLPDRKTLYEETAEDLFLDFDTLRKQLRTGQLDDLTPFRSKLAVVEGYVNDVEDTSEGYRVKLGQRGQVDTVIVRITSDYLDAPTLDADVAVFGNVYIPNTDDADEEPNIVMRAYDIVEEGSGPEIPDIQNMGEGSETEQDTEEPETEEETGSEELTSEESTEDTAEDTGQESEAEESETEKSTESESSEEKSESSEGNKGLFS